MPAPKKDRSGKADQTVPGGAYIEGGVLGDDDKHYGGRVVDADGNVLAEFEDDEVNDGKPHGKDRDEHKAADDKPPATPTHSPTPTPPAPKPPAK